MLMAAVEKKLNSPEVVRGHFVCRLISSPDKTTRSKSDNLGTSPFVTLGE